MKLITKTFAVNVKLISFNQRLIVPVFALFLLGTSELGATCISESYDVTKKNEVAREIDFSVIVVPPDTTMITDATTIFSVMEDTILITPGNVFDTIFDSYGNSYSLNSLMVHEEETSFRTFCDAGYFHVIFEPNCGMNPTGTQLEADRAAVVCQVLSDISDFIASPLSTSGEKVNIWVRDLSQIVTSPSTSGVLGLASSFYVLPSGTPLVGGIADNEIWKTIISGIDSYTGVVSPLISSNTNPGSPANFFHGMMAFNFSNSSINWHIDMGAANPSGYFDLYSVVLHEITHALGFASLINDDGTSKFGANFNYYSRYDLFLENQSSVNLINGTFSGCSLYDFEFNSALTPANVITPPNASPNTCVTNQTVCGNAVIYSGGTTVPVYTPNCFEPPSTLSHFEDQCFPSGTPYGNDVYFNMSNAQNTGANKRFLQEEEAIVLCDLGYSLNSTYGDNMVVSGSFKDYGSTCTGLEVSGVNDGIAAGGYYAFIGPTTAPIDITGILSNDYNADAFECLQVILGGGSTNFTSGTTATALEYTSSTPGLKLLRYVPYNTTSGKRGNITYIIVYVTDNGCTASVCDIMNNVGFESVANGCGPFGGSYTVTLNCWEPICLTPDVFVRGCTDLFGYYNTGNSTLLSNPASDTYNGTPNDNFMGIWSYQSSTNYLSEGAQTLLSSPLIPSEEYVLSFWGKVNNNFIANIPASIGFASYPNLSAPIFINQDFTAIVPNSVMVVPAVTVPNDNTWHYYSIPFTFSGTANHNALAVYYDDPGGSAPDVHAYVFIDDVSIQPQSEAVLLNFPEQICTSEQISDLSVYLTPPIQDGEFSGDGVTESGGVYSFDGATAGVGDHLITYTYETSVGCTLSVYSFIEVTPTCICTGDNITDFDWTNTFSLSPLNTYELGSNVSVTGNNVVLTDAIITISPDIIITVENGASLTLDHCHLYTCGDMWGGIVVEPGGQLTIINNSMIEDAMNAIYIQNHTATTPILTIQESIFNRNFINVYILDYLEQVGTYPFEIQNSVFTSREISYTSTTWPTVADLTMLANSGDLDEHYAIGNYPPAFLKPPFSIYSSGAGVYLDNVGVLNGGTFYEMQIDGDDGAGTFNLFDEMFFGIFAQNSNFTSRNNVFQFMNQPLPNFGKGIMALNNDIGVDQFRIVVEEENRFYDCPTGIEVQGYTDVQISNTNMRSTQMPVTTIPDEGELGIFVETPYLLGMEIRENTITNVRNGVVFLADVDQNVPNNQGQMIGPVSISENIIQATLDGNSGTPTDEYVLNGIIADNTLFGAGVLSGVSNPIVIAENKLYQVHNGIHTQYWIYFMLTVNLGFQNRLNDRDNYISLRKIEYPSSTNQQQYGIMHVLNFSARMENNTVDGFGNGFEEWYGVVAADLINPNSVRPRVTCNTISNTGIGIHFSFSSNLAIFHDNTMDNNQYGLVLDNGASIGHQGSDSYASGNKWINFTSGNFETFTMNGSDPNNSLLWIDNSDADQVPTLNGDFSAIPYSYTDGLSNVTTNNNTTTCNAPTGLILNEDNDHSQEKAGNSLVDLLEKLVTDSLSYGFYPEEQYIEARHRAYRMMRLQPDWVIEAPNELHEFYAVAHYGNIGRLSKVEQRLGTGEYNAAQGLLNSVQPENSIEANYKAFFTAYLHAKQDVFTVNDSLVLNELIHGCVARDGIVVNHARVLHRLLYRDFKTYFDDCQGDSHTKEMISVLGQDRTNLILYPNPSMGEVWFEVENTADKPTKIEVYALDGTLIHNEIPLGNKINFDFSSGTYFVVISTKSESYRGRVIIIR